jgi:hypothetical protein
VKPILDLVAVFVGTAAVFYVLGRYYFPSLFARRVEDAIADAYKNGAKDQERYERDRREQEQREYNARWKGIEQEATEANGYYVQPRPDLDPIPVDPHAVYFTPSEVTEGRVRDGLVYASYEPPMSVEDPDEPPYTKKELRDLDNSGTAAEHTEWIHSLDEAADKAAEEAATEIENRFLGDTENWKPTGFRVPNFPYDEYSKPGILADIEEYVRDRNEFLGKEISPKWRDVEMTVEHYSPPIAIGWANDPNAIPVDADGFPHITFRQPDAAEMAELEERFRKAFDEDTARAIRVLDERDPVITPADTGPVTPWLREHRARHGTELDLAVADEDTWFATFQARTDAMAQDILDAENNHAQQ